MPIYAFIFGILIAIIASVLIFFCYQIKYSVHSKNSLKSDKIINRFELNTSVPKLTEMIDYHRARDIVRYKIDNHS